MLTVSIGIVHLSTMANLNTGFIAGVSVLIYLVLYTPVKKITSLCTLFGAISGALPPMIGWSAVKGSLSLEGWSLSGILFIWQIPHLLALAWIYREDYARAGMKMTPLSDETGFTTAKIALLFSLLLLPVSLVPYFISLTGPFYMVGAILLGMSLLGVSYYFLSRPNNRSAKILFMSTILYIPLLSFLMIAGR